MSTFSCNESRSGSLYSSRVVNLTVIGVALASVEPSERIKARKISCQILQNKSLYNYMTYTFPC